MFGTLPTLWLPPSNFAVTSVLGYWSAPRTLEPVDVAEVGSILHHPIHLLIDPANRFSVEHPTGWRGPAFEVGCGGAALGLHRRRHQSLVRTTRLGEAVG